MNIHTIATGSGGNAYLLAHGHSSLLIEAGIGFNSLVKKLWEGGLTVTMLDGCLISHCHQ